MKTTALLLSAALAALSLVPASASSEPRLYVNGFRAPSIGLEYQRKAWSFHGGMYCTVVSKDDDGDNETTWFVRGGAAWWPWRFAFVDVSYLYGLNHDYRNDQALMVNPGLQGVFWDVLVLRIGVAVLASPDHDFKINPTPGISLAFSL